ncbi:MAG: MgtC/SapB family protein [Oscillospiraceae bacterium]|jgi:putative Mg2+ transporter-C (MgtC) family protein|nr:MgtC/SapB family protein [Oscillospiraceae bacterium]
MLECLEFIRELDFLAIFLRLSLAVLCGGAIGLERSVKHRPAGFRTHILICLGAAMTTLTSQYMLITMNMFTDVSRLGAQVIAGIGFIGAGTIIVTKSQSVKGLTTAAGLWTAAIIGLVCGAGFAELAVLVTAMVLFAELVLSKIESKFARKVSDVNIYIEYSRAAAIEEIYAILREKKIVVSNFEISRVRGSETQHHYCAVISFRASKAQMDAALHKSFTEVKDVITVEEI